MKVSVIIPAWNEEQLLPACLESVRMAFAARPDLRPEVIVVDNNSTDGTAALANAAGARVVFEAKNQIARARNTGAAVATGLAVEGGGPEPLRPRRWRRHEARWMPRPRREWPPPRWRRCPPAQKPPPWGRGAVCVCVWGEGWGWGVGGG